MQNLGLYKLELGAQGKAQEYETPEKAQFLPQGKN